MHTLTALAWKASASQAQRAYLAQTEVLAGLLDHGGLLGWETLDELRSDHALLEDDWPTVEWPVVCGPRGGEVSRYVAALNELRMAPQDLHVLAYSHELAHALNPTAGHNRHWAISHLYVLTVMRERLPQGKHIDPLGVVLVRLQAAYKRMDVLS